VTVHRSHSERAAVRQPSPPIADPTAKGLGPKILITEGTRFDAVRAITHVQKVEGWTAAESRQALDVLGLLPPPAVTRTGPRAVVCPTCAAAVGAACTQNGGRDTYGRIHVARTKAAREAA
jgi:hypothetical protein